MSILKRERDSRASASLASDLAASEKSSEAWASRLRAFEYASAVVVVLGVVLDDTTWFSSLFGNPILWSSLKNGGWGGAMIALGIMAETLFSMLVSGREKKISSVNAQRRVDAEHDTAVALQEVAIANSRLEEEITERTKLQARLLAKRTIRDDAFPKIVGLLKPFSGTLVQFAVFDEHFEEVWNIQNQMRAAFLQAGWRLTGWTAMGVAMVTGSPPPRIPGEGILFCTSLSTNGAPLRDACDRIVNILNEGRANVAGVAFLRKDGFAPSYNAFAGGLQAMARGEMPPAVEEEIPGIRVQISERQIV